MKGRCACGVLLRLVVRADHWECRGESAPAGKSLEERIERWERMSIERRMKALGCKWEGSTYSAMGGEFKKGRE